MPTGRERRGIIRGIMQVKSEKVKVKSEAEVKPKAEKAVKGAKKENPKTVIPETKEEQKEETTPSVQATEKGEE